MAVPASAVMRGLADGDMTSGGPTQVAGNYLVAPQTWRPAPNLPANGGTGRQPRTSTSGVLLAAASVLPTALAVAMGVVSWHAQYAFIFFVKHQHSHLVHSPLQCRGHEPVHWLHVHSLAMDYSCRQ